MNYSSIALEECVSECEKYQVKPTKWGFCSCVAWQGKGGREISPNMNARNTP